MKFAKGKIFQLFLITTSLIVVIAFFLFLRDIDSQYSILMQHENRVFNQLMEISKNSRHNFQILFEILLTKDKEQIDSLAALRNQLAGINDQIIDSLPNYADDMNTGRQLYNNMVTARQLYLERCGRFLDRPESQNYNFLSGTVQPAFYEYQQKFESYYAYSKFRLLSNKTAISREIENRSIIYLLIGVSPLLLISAVALLIVVFLTLALGLLAKIDQSKTSNKSEQTE